MRDTDTGYTERPRSRCLHFRIGNLEVTLESESRGVAEDFVGLYHGYRIDRPVTNDPMRLAVRRHKRRFPWRRRYAVTSDGAEVCRSCRPKEVLPALEWSIAQRVVRTLTGYLQIHAATLVRGDQAYVFPGRSGSGKSTLAAALLSRGWNYFSDEITLIDPDTRRAHPFPRALCIKAGSFQVLRDLAVPPRRQYHYVKTLRGPVTYVPPPYLIRATTRIPRPIRFIVFPTYAGGREARLRTISRAEAAFELSRCVFNRNVFGLRTTPLLAAIVRDAECFALDSGLIRPTCDLLESLPR